MVSHSLSLSILCKILNPKLSALNDARKQWEVEAEVRDTGAAEMHLEKAKGKAKGKRGSSKGKGKAEGKHGK